jgi:hypothetical protein
MRAPWWQRWQQLDSATSYGGLKREKPNKYGSLARVVRGFFSMRVQGVQGIFNARSLYY